MKFITAAARIIVGCLFVFSGLVKGIDPLGLTYKMGEFFEAWSNSGFLPSMMKWLDSHAFLFSVIMITLEVALGVALLAGWARKVTLNLLLLLMLFFTFLTAYVLFSGKIRACGCFGDCIPLTPIQTFTKDIILLLLLMMLFAGKKYIEPVLKTPFTFIIVLMATVLTILLQLYVVKHLPLVDCLPYKKGNNILELRKMPADAIPDKYEYVFIYEKNGTTKEFTKDFPDSTWKFVDRRQTLVQKGKNNVPLINDFSLTAADGADSTETILNKPSYWLFFVKNMEEAVSWQWSKAFEVALRQAESKGVPVYIITADKNGAEKYFNNDKKYNLPVYVTDGIAIKTAARANPTMFVMKGPVVQEKYSWADLDQLAR